MVDIPMLGDQIDQVFERLLNLLLIDENPIDFPDIIIGINSLMMIEDIELSNNKLQ
jgi:hypothetical protein